MGSPPQESKQENGKISNELLLKEKENTFALKGRYNILIIKYRGHE